MGLSGDPLHAAELIEFVAVLEVEMLVAFVAGPLLYAAIGQVVLLIWSLYAQILCLAAGWYCHQVGSLLEIVDAMLRGNGNC